MRKVLTGCVSLGLGLLSWSSGAVDQYVELKSGICIPQERQGMHYKKAPCFSVEYGLSWSAWRLGLQLGYVKYENKDVPLGELHDTVFGYHEYKDKKFTAIAYMANLYYSWHWCSNLDLYVGCGLGVVRLNYRFRNTNGDLMEMEMDGVYNQDKYLLAAQLMCGVSYALSDHWSVSFGYRCMKIEKVKYNEIEEPVLWPSLKTPLLHSLEVGLRYSF